MNCRTNAVHSGKGERKSVNKSREIKAEVEINFSHLTAQFSFPIRSEFEVLLYLVRLVETPSSSIDTLFEHSGSEKTVSASTESSFCSHSTNRTLIIDWSAGRIFSGTYFEQRYLIELLIFQYLNVNRSLHFFCFRFLLALVREDGWNLCLNRLSGYVKFEQCIPVSRQI